MDLSPLGADLAYLFVALLGDYLVILAGAFVGASVIYGLLMVTAFIIRNQ